jgi:hypothetical protein
MTYAGCSHVITSLLVYCAQRSLLNPPRLAPCPTAAHGPRTAAGRSHVRCFAFGVCPSQDVLVLLCIGGLHAARRPRLGEREREKQGMSRVGQVSLSRCGVCSSDGELIKRSDNKELDPHVIKRQFCEGAKNDCVAYYVSYTKGSKGEGVHPHDPLACLYSSMDNLIFLRASHS